MNGNDLLRAARALQIAAESEPPADLTKAKSDIRKLAQMMNQLCDLHDGLAARVCKLEQMAGIDGPIGLLKSLH